MERDSKEGRKGRTEPERDRKGSRETGDPESETQKDGYETPRDSRREKGRGREKQRNAEKERRSETERDRGNEATVERGA